MPSKLRPQHLVQEEQHSFPTWFLGSQTIQKVLEVARLLQQLLSLLPDHTANDRPTPNPRGAATQEWPRFHLLKNR